MAGSCLDFAGSLIGASFVPWIPREDLSAEKATVDITWWEGGLTLTSCLLHSGVGIFTFGNLSYLSFEILNDVLKFFLRGTRNGELVREWQLTV